MNRSERNNLLRRKKTVLLLAGLFLISIAARSQGYYSLRTSNFGGLQNNILNPAGSVDTKLYMDINLFSGSAYLYNNFFYIPRQDFRITTYLFNRDGIPRYEPYALFPGGIPFLNRNGMKNPRESGQVNIMGPSAMISINHQTLTFFTALRLSASSNIPEVYLEYLIKGNAFRKLYSENVGLPKFRGGLLFWGETGIGYATVLNRNSVNTWSLGGNLKFLTGYLGYFIRNDDDITYTINTDHILTLSDVSMTYGSTAAPRFGLPYGYGAGMDLGMVYTKRGHYKPYDYFRSLRDQSYRDYQFKFGFSVTDLGIISFSRNASTSRMKSDGSILITELEQLGSQPFDSINKLLADHVYEIVTPVPDVNRFSMNLPARFSAFFDYHVNPEFYVSTLLVTGIPFPGTLIRQPFVFTVCPRYETRNFEIWLPVSYNQYSKLQAGLAVRAWYFTVGTERLLTTFIKSDFRGFDIFLGIRFPFIKKVVH